MQCFYFIHVGTEMQKNDKLQSPSGNQYEKALQ